MSHAPLSQWQKDLRFTTGLLLKRPFQILVQVTNRCNLKCSFCDFWPNPAPRGEELTVADYRRVSEELAAIGCFIVSVEGGEPFSRPDILEIVAAFSRHHITLFFSNGWLLNEDRAKSLFQAGVAQASVSIDFPDAARQDRKRGAAGCHERAWQAVHHLRAAAPRSSRQVSVMSVLMQENETDVESLLQQTAAADVGHQLTLISTAGYRRTGADAPPSPEAVARLPDLWARYPHLRFYRSYFDRMHTFLTHDEAVRAAAGMPACDAGLRSMNLDHVGQISACIERINEPVGNVKDASIADLYRRLQAQQDQRAGCQRCWTACRGLLSAAGHGGPQDWLDMATRLRPT